MTKPKNPVRKKSAPQTAPGRESVKREFARAIVEGKSQSDAFRQARPNTTANDKTVWEEASRLARDPLVRQTIAELSAMVDAQFSINAAALLQESLRIGLSDPSRIIGMKDGKPVVLLPHELDEDTRAAIASFEIDDLGRMKYKFWDKNNALERLFKHKGLFKEDNSQKPVTVERIELVALQPLQPKEPKA
jgi:phage terminase small subunit